MKLLEKQKINRKFTLLFGVIIFGFIVLGFSYALVLESQGAAEAELRQALDYQEATKEASETFTLIRVLSQEFYLTYELSVLSDYYDRITALNENLKQLISGAATEEQKQLAQQATKEVEAHTLAYKEASDAVVELGLTQDLGLRGKMRNFVHNAEEAIKKVKSVYLDRSMLLMRRHEKDFLVRKLEKYVDRHAKEYRIFTGLLRAASLPSKERGEIATNMSKYRDSFNGFVAGVRKSDSSRARLGTVAESTSAAMNNLFVSAQGQVETIRQAQTGQANLALTWFGIAIIMVTIMISATLYFLARDIIRPMRVLQNTIGEVNRGNMGARVMLSRGDEIGELGNAFDNLLDERISSLQEAEKEAERLNNSVVTLIKAVKVISDKDFTQKVPVSEDITGVISDSLNLLVSETTKILGDIRNISYDISGVSSVVKTQSDTVIKVADFERTQVEQAASSLEDSSKTMVAVAEHAQEASNSADAAIQTTEGALQAVNNTIEGINGIRGTISETEKRMKRLGERSQEITRVVSLINAIAERTHTLALNASMHAASAGAAGRGFAVVADEVQRLAENAREATSEISVLVDNIRIETVDTVNTMNEAISQVAKGTKLAGQAGEIMKTTQERTTELVNYVQQIAQESKKQAETTEALRVQAANIKASTYKTSEELGAQTKSTEELVAYAGKLVNAVSVFKLSDAPRDDQPEPATKGDVGDVKTAV